MRFHRVFTGTVALSLTLLGCSNGKNPVQKPAPAITGAGFELQYDPAFFQGGQTSQEPRLTMAEIGTDIPLDNAPARVKFTLIPAGAMGGRPDSGSEASVRVIPLKDPSVPDYAKAYPALQKDAEDLRAILKAGAVHPEISKDLPDWNCEDCEETIHAKAQIVDTPWCAGVQFLTTYVQEAAEIDNERLVYKFEGLSKDGAYFIAVEVPLRHPSLPIRAPGLDSMNESQVKAYYAQAEDQLNRADDDTFKPSLVSLREMVKSLRPARP